MKRQDSVLLLTQRIDAQANTADADWGMKAAWLAFDLTVFAVMVLFLA